MRRAGWSLPRLGAFRRLLPVPHILACLGSKTVDAGRAFVDMAIAVMSRGILGTEPSGVDLFGLQR